MNDLLVVIPTYNERENLATVIRRLLATVPEAHVLVVDDNSPDGTGALAVDLAAADSRVHVLHRGAKSGLGAAYRAGFAWGMNRDYRRYVELDADGSHQPEQLPRLLAELESADIVLGSRWITGGSVENWPARRIVLSIAGSSYARFALGVPVRDVTGGYRAFTLNALHEIGLGNISSQGYCFQIDMMRQAHLTGLHIVEVPITFVERVHGVSKMSSWIVIEALARVTVWGIRGLPGRIRGRRRGVKATRDVAHA